MQKASTVGAALRVAADDHSAGFTAAAEVRPPARRAEPWAMGRSIMDGASRGPDARDWDGQQLVPNFRSDQAQDLVELPLVFRILLLVDCRGLIKPSLRTEMRIAR